MKFEFQIKDDGSLPLVHIDGKRLSIVQLTYSWHTKTADVGSGANVCVVDGYFEGSDTLRRFLYDILMGVATEISLTPVEDETERVFEVCVDMGNSLETENWVVVPFNLLQPGHLIRIKDKGVYYHDLSGNGLWVVVDSPNIANGVINVITYQEYQNSIEKGLS